jgi:hypothetical protein
MKDIRVCSECGQESFLTEELCSKCYEGINNPLGLIRNNVVSSDIMAFLWFSVSRKQSGLFIGDTRDGRKNLMNQSIRFAPPETDIKTVEKDASMRFQRDRWDAFYPPDDGLCNQISKIVEDSPEFLVIGDIPDKTTIQYSMLMSVLFSSYTLYASSHCDQSSNPEKTLLDRGVPKIMMNEIDFVCEVQKSDNEVGYVVKDVHGIKCKEEGKGYCEQVKLFEWDNGFENRGYLDFIQNKYGQEARDNCKDLETVLDKSLDNNSGIRDFCVFLNQCNGDQIS